MENIMYGSGGVFTLVYVVSAFPYATGFCEDLESGYVRYQIIRKGFRTYTFEKAAVVFLSSMLAATIGFFLFFCIKRMSCPWVSEGYEPQVGWMQLMEQGRYMMWFFLYSLQWGIWFGTLAVCAALGSVYIPNRFLTWALPMLINQMLVETGVSPAPIYDAGYAASRNSGWLLFLEILICMTVMSLAAAAIKYRIHKVI